MLWYLLTRHFWLNTFYEICQKCQILQYANNIYKIPPFLYFLNRQDQRSFSTISLISILYAQLHAPYSSLRNQMSTKFHVTNDHNGFVTQILARMIIEIGGYYIEHNMWYLESVFAAIRRIWQLWDNVFNNSTILVCRADFLLHMKFSVAIIFVICHFFNDLKIYWPRKFRVTWNRVGIWSPCSNNILKSPFWFNLRNEPCDISIIILYQWLLWTADIILFQGCQKASQLALPNVKVC
jgi:hypothetical protein